MIVGSRKSLMVTNLIVGTSRIASAFLPACPFGSISGSASSSSTASNNDDPWADPSPSDASSVEHRVSTPLNSASIETAPKVVYSHLHYDSLKYPQQLYLPESTVQQLEHTRVRKEMTFKKVPSSKTARAMSFGSLFMQIGWDKLWHTTPNGGILSSNSHEKIVSTLCRMRGSVLKLGQMLSIQDEKTVPPAITALFETVRDQAYAMPPTQLQSMMAEELHDSAWRRTVFESFDAEPVGAASIGQVHYGMLKDPHCEVAVKIQYPGVARSIDSDVGLLKILMGTNVLPSGMFVEKIMEELREELSNECRYTLEAEKQTRYRDHVLNDPKLSELFNVPKVFSKYTTDQIIISEFIRGVPIDKFATTPGVPQELKNYVAEQIMRLTLTELFEWNFMQTDPNYSNFLFDARHGKVHLIDFGAARSYDKSFVDTYLDVVAAAGRKDRDTIIEKSITLGFLTGGEVKEMMDAHASSVLVLGKAFCNPDKPFSFAAEHLPSQVQHHVPTMVQLRLRPPPTPIYSLHRRLSGTILICTRLGATIDSGKLFWDVYEKCKKEQQTRNGAQTQ